MRDDISSLWQDNQSSIFEASTNSEFTLIFTMSIKKWQTKLKNTSNWLALGWRTGRFFTRRQVFKKSQCCFPINQKIMWSLIESDSTEWRPLMTSSRIFRMTWISLFWANRKTFKRNWEKSLNEEKQIDSKRIEQNICGKYTNQDF